MRGAIASSAHLFMRGKGFAGLFASPASLTQVLLEWRSN